jgi:hypothetical protein
MSGVSRIDSWAGDFLQRMELLMCVCKNGGHVSLLKKKPAGQTMRARNKKTRRIARAG